MAVTATDLPIPRHAPRSLKAPLAGVVTLLLLVAAFAFWLRASEASHLTVSVHGERARVSRRALSASVAPYLKTGFFGVNLEGIQKAVEALPWVARAQVRRRWPGSVRITLHAHRPVARWGDDALLGADGERFTPAKPARFAHLPHLSGPADSEQKLLSTYHRMQSVLKPTPYRLKSLWINPRGAWRARLRSNLGLRFGRNHVMQRMTRFAGPVVNALGPRLDQIAYVDLRYSNGFAVGWKQQQEDRQ